MTKKKNFFPDMCECVCGCTRINFRALALAHLCQGESEWKQMGHDGEWEARIIYLLRGIFYPVYRVIRVHFS
jgi:hypothetical protein